jgi:hypothetical protein
VTGSALELLVDTFERIGCEFLVVESLDLERIGDVTRIARAFGRGETKLPGVNIPMAAPALTWRTAVGCPFSTEAVLFGRTVTAITRGLGVRACQRPGTVVDLWRIPPVLGVAVGTAAIAHFDRELITVRIVMAVDASLRPELQIVPGSLSLMTTRTTNRLMLPVERKLGPTVLLDGEQRGPEPVLVMATSAVGRPEAAAMGVAVTVRALLETQASIPPLHRELR